MKIYSNIVCIKNVLTNKKMMHFIYIEINHCKGGGPQEKCLAKQRYISQGQEKFHMFSLQQRSIAFNLAYSSREMHA